jgi:hypothetical protein
LNRADLIFAIEALNRMFAWFAAHFIVLYRLWVIRAFNKANAAALPGDNLLLP